MQVAKREVVSSMINKKMLLEKLKEKDLTQDSFAAELGINPSTLFRKLTGGSDFTRAEIQITKKVLNLSLKEADEIFFKL